jgi:serine/threonine protein kinase
LIGRKINNYEIISLLGEGGMGSVYVAEHPVLGRRVAVKMLRREFAEDPALVARFMNEARAASAIRQPNIIEILDVGTLPDGIPYLMMELLEGESLAGRLFREKRLSIDDAVAIAAQAMTGLGAAHAKQIVHRDLKPDNIFLAQNPSDPSGHQVVILDFGIAKLRGDLSTGSVKTRIGSVMGTPPYMSPEQCRGLNDDIDHRTDIYAMGIILHEMLTGAPPFVAVGFGDMLMLHMMQPPAPLRSLDDRIPPHIEAAVLRALQKTREARFSSIDEMKRALLEPSARPVSVAPATHTLRFEEAPHGEPRRAATEQMVVSPTTISTLTSSTGEMVAAQPATTDVDTQRAQPTLPVRRSRRALSTGAVLLGAGGVAAAIIVGATQARSKHAAAPGTAQELAAPVPTPSRAPVPLPFPAPSPNSGSPPEPAVVAPAADAPPVEVEPEHRDLASTAKHAPAARPARGKSRGAQPSRVASAPAVAAPSAAPAPKPTTAPAPVAPPARPTPQINTEKW